MRQIARCARSLLRQLRARAPRASRALAACCVSFARARRAPRPLRVLLEHEAAAHAQPRSPHLRRLPSSRLARSARSDIAHANKALATGVDAAHTLAYFAFKTGEALYKTGQLEQASAAFVQATRCANPTTA